MHMHVCACIYLGMYVFEHVFEVCMSSCLRGMYVFMSSRYVCLHVFEVCMSTSWHLHGALCMCACVYIYI
jgi:hypothetical protein